MSVFTAWMVMMFAIVVVTLALRETVPTASRINEVQNLAAARAGTEAALARIKGVTQMQTGLTTAVTLGDTAELPCGPFVGTSDGTAQGASYHGMVRYYKSNPMGTSVAWREHPANIVPCDVVATEGAAFALISATGDDVAVDGLIDPERMLEVVYELTRFTKIDEDAGGHIRFMPMPSYGGTFEEGGCLTASLFTVRDPDDGWGNLTYEQCDETATAVQHWVHRPDMTLALASTLQQGSARPNLCVVRESYTGLTHSRAWLDECPVDASSSANHVFRFMVTVDRQMSGMTTSRRKLTGPHEPDNFCLKPSGDEVGPRSNIRFGDPVQYEGNCGIGLDGWHKGDPMDSTRKTYVVVDGRVGNPASKYPRFITNYHYPGMCLNIDEGLSNGRLIMWYCEIDKVVAERRNTEFSYRDAGSGMSNIMIPKLVSSNPGYCLAPPASLGSPPSVYSQYCGSRMDQDRFQWRVHDVTSDWFTSNTIQHVGTGLCLTATDRAFKERGRQVDLLACDGSDAQKWNVRYVPQEGGLGFTRER